MANHLNEPILSSNPQHNVVVHTVYGPMIINRHAGEFDCLAKLGKSSTHRDIEIVCTLAYCCGPGALVMDVGACWGTYTLALAKLLAPTGGCVVSFEPQKWLYQAMLGSLALNDITNVESRQYAVGDKTALVTIPGLDYTRQASFGSVPMLEYADEHALSDIGQKPDPDRQYQTQMITIDSLNANPALIKIDTEGMEMAVLRGAERTIEQWRPVVYFEHIKGDKDALVKWIEDRGYEASVNGCDYACIPHEKRHLFPQWTYGDDTETRAA